MQFWLKICNFIPNIDQNRRLLIFFSENYQSFWWNFWFYTCDQKLLLVTFYVKSYLTTRTIRLNKIRNIWNKDQDISNNPVQYWEIENIEKLVEVHFEANNISWNSKKSKYRGVLLKYKLKVACFELLNINSHFNWTTLYCLNWNSILYMKPCTLRGFFSANIPQSARYNTSIDEYRVSRLELCHFTMLL